MDRADVSYELLRYIDGDTANESIEHASGLPTRGVGWVLSWAVAIAVLGIATGVLTRFACLLAAERILARAARAAAFEATLPCATFETVYGVAERRLANEAALASSLSISLMQNGAPVGRTFRPRPSDRITVTLTARTSAALPRWVQMLNLWKTDEPITAQAQRTMPGNEIPAGGVRRAQAAP